MFTDDESTRKPGRIHHPTLNNDMRYNSQSQKKIKTPKLMFPKDILTESVKRSSNFSERKNYL